jgi:hypothetical protein
MLLRDTEDRSLHVFVRHPVPDSIRQFNMGEFIVPHYSSQTQDYRTIKEGASAREEKKGKGSSEHSDICVLSLTNLDDREHRHGLQQN